MGKLMVGLRGLLLLCAVIVAFSALEGAHSAPAGAKWVVGSPMVSAHGNTALATLQDGRVLAVSGNDGVRLTTTTELFDPNTGQWTKTGSTNQGRNAFRPPILLRDGKVLIAAGHDEKVVDYATAELYNPTTGRWTFTGSLNIARRYAVLVGLQDGRVLAANGAHGPPDANRFLSSAELYDPHTGRWTHTTSALLKRESASGILLHDGRVLLLGGYSCCDVFLPVTELFDPRTSTWSRVGDLPSGRSGAALVVLPDGRVLAVGGASNVSNGPLAQTLLFNPTTSQWTKTGDLHFARSGANAVLLAHGKVLIAGGGPLESELYDPATGTWSVDASLAFVHNGGTMVLLPNGDVLMAGGGIGTEGTVTEIYRAAPMPPATQTSSFTFEVDAKRGWQSTSLEVTKGQQVSFSAVGSWTVDYRNFPYVGPNGYSLQVDRTIWQGCKLGPSLPYGLLLARVGDDPKSRIIGSETAFTADRDGVLAFRIHDGDACLGDNDGTVTVTVTLAQSNPQQKAQAVPTPPVPQPVPTPTSPRQWTVTSGGIGPLRVGMSVTGARAALGGKFAAGDSTVGCAYVALTGLPGRVLAMVVDSRVVRIEVKDRGVATATGARVGDSEARITSLYPGRVQVQPHKYTNGHYLIVTPEVAADSANRLIFETDGRNVLEYRAGLLPAVAWVEGCN